LGCKITTFRTYRIRRDSRTRSSFLPWDTQLLAGTLQGSVFQSESRFFRLHGTRARFWHRNRIFLLSQRVTACTIFPHRSSVLSPAFSPPIMHQPPNVAVHSDCALSGVSASLFVPYVVSRIRALSAARHPHAVVWHCAQLRSTIFVMLDVLEQSAAVPVHSLSTATVQSSTQLTTSKWHSHSGLEQGQ
jgi:hypothetical protein